MVFKSKIDKYYLYVLISAIVIIGIACVLPLFLDKQIDLFGIVCMLSIFFLTVGFLLWISFSISYSFQENHLLVKTGPFKKRVQYIEITSIRPTKDIFTGYRILSSMDAIAISYRSGLMGEIKISPKDKEAFLSELRARVPAMKENK
ncbi:PH domain-containing protein [Cytobacillus praedii]|uniref:PH domain-containing protein n=1 Tax=Cytobacillus praedii TaxID=1742358 RepID=UPI002E201673|nr:PH domain-containing protein [Cytobacillus praedii]